jgi:predicted nucleic acid-binding protein
MERTTTSIDNEGLIQADLFKVLIDANLVMDVLLDRQCASLEDTDHILGLIHRKEIIGYMTERGLEDIHSIATKLKGKDVADSIQQDLKILFQICEIDKKLIEDATQSSAPNFDSTIQIACLQNLKLDAIITLSSKDFLGLISRDSERFFPIFDPAEFLNTYYGDLKALINDLSLELPRDSDDQNSSDNFVDTPPFYDDYPLKPHLPRVYSSNLSESQECLTSTRQELEKTWKLSSYMEEYRDKKIAIGSEWCLDSCIFHTVQGDFVVARVTLSRIDTGEHRTKVIQASGVVEALCKAVDSLVFEIYPQLKVFPKPIFHGFTVKNHLGLEAPVQAEVTVKIGNESFVGVYAHRNLHRAIFFAYIVAIDDFIHQRKVKVSQVLKKITQHSCSPEFEIAQPVFRTVDHQPESLNILRELTPVVQTLMSRSHQCVSAKELEIIGLFSQFPHATFTEAGLQLKYSCQRAEQEFGVLKKKLEKSLLKLPGMDSVDIQRENLLEVLRSASVLTPYDGLLKEPKEELSPNIVQVRNIREHEDLRDIDESASILYKLTPVVQTLMRCSGHQVSVEDMELIKFRSQFPSATFVELGHSLDCSEQEAFQKISVLKEKLEESIQLCKTRLVDIDQESLQKVLNSLSIPTSISKPNQCSDPMKSDRGSRDILVEGRLFQGKSSSIQPRTQGKNLLASVDWEKDWQRAVSNPQTESDLAPKKWIETLSRDEDGVFKCTPIIILELDRGDIANRGMNSLSVIKDLNSFSNRRSRLNVEICYEGIREAFRDHMNARMSIHCNWHHSFYDQSWVASRSVIRLCPPPA